jgi:hypothetical protein
MTINCRDLILPLEISGKNLGNGGHTGRKHSGLMGHVVSVPIKYDAKSGGSNYGVTSGFAFARVAMGLRGNSGGGISCMLIERAFAHPHDELPGSRANVSSFKGNNTPSIHVYMELSMHI